MSLAPLDPILADFRTQILEAAKNGRTINIQGGNTKQWYGDHPQGEVLSTTPYQGIIDYQPAELVITAKAGTPMRVIEEVLAQASQTFPFEPPHFGANATIGGVVAAGLSGPGRGQSGALKDFVLGVKLMDGRGDVVSFGGQVMKNVAGYDVSRLIPGSMGTLGLLLEVSIKVLPISAKTQTLCFGMDQASAITQMNTWASLPLPLSASHWLGQTQGTLMLRLAGANAAVNSATQKLLEQYTGEVVEATLAKEFWQSVKEHTHPYFQIPADQSLWRFAVNPLSPPLPLPGATCLEWLGGLRWYVGALEMAQARAIAQQFGGHVTHFRGKKVAGTSVFTSLMDNPLTAPLALVQERLRKGFDPHGIFKTNRMP